MARAIVEYDDVIDYLERMNSSVNGNPRYRIHYRSGHVAATQSDAGISYGLVNPNMIGVPVHVRATQTGQVFDVRPL